MTQHIETGEAVHDEPPDTSGFPRLNTTDVRAPWRWLAAAWRDLRRAPGASLFYGGVFVTMGFLLQFFFTDQPHITLGLATGFALLGPFLCIGLYDISRRLERDGVAPLVATLTAWRENQASIAFYAIILMLLMAAWMRVSVVLIALFYQGAVPSSAALVKIVLSSSPDFTFLAVYFGVGGFFATLVFSVSAISIPLMMDRGTDTITAMIASVVAVVRSFPALMAWALAIGVLIFTGLATAFVGLLVTVPLIGHGTWHAYRELVPVEHDTPAA